MTQFDQNPESGVGAGGEHSQSPAELREATIAASRELILLQQLRGADTARAAAAATIGGEKVEM